ncbi:DEAD/DEAH box helicase [Sphingomonas solaris]|uniref:Helicase n=1 Tax=Alterirhizorhabdus solaris TaxID=2529389 RepID=A0A558RDM5_9SPHN|nr:AAA domain-containing protein [Sphingomonas solaris]TVV77464.1 helicase [Sphingomonas solaris]
MAKQAKAVSASLDDRFRFADDSFPGVGGVWQSQLRIGIGVDDGEGYLLRLFKKTGTPLDDDLRRLIARGLRRVRRLLSSRRSRNLLVEVRGVVEDRHEFAILMLDPGTPVSSPARVRAKQGLFLSGAGRKTFWRNIARIAEALADCHDAGIVHGAVSEHVFFSHGDDREDYRLGGYETCVHISDGDLGGAHHPLRSSGAISFRQDWMDLGRAAASILGITADSGPSLISIERRMLDRLANPPQYQLFDGGIVLRDLREVIAELDRVGSSSEGEMVLYPTSDVLRGDLPQLTSGTITANDTAAVLRFVEEDMLRPDARADFSGRGIVKVFTDLAVYGVKIVDNRFGMLVSAEKRRPADRIYDAVELKHRLHLSRTRQTAEDRVRKLGPGAIPWTDSNDPAATQNALRDVTPWYALIVLEAFTWLRDQFRIYPIEILPASPGDEENLVWVVPRTESDRDQRRVRMGMRTAEEAFRRDLRDDDGKAAWTLTPSDKLAGGRDRLPDVLYLGSSLYRGRQAYAFASKQPITARQGNYLRPRPESGSERAIRRRLQNIVAARTNVDLLRALDDPAQVGFDEMLRDIAAPGEAPADLDDTKARAWQSIASGKSINVVVGPPGVGKTFLISQLVRNILSITRDARILISAQNHETLVQMEAELRSGLSETTSIVVRVEKPGDDDKLSALRQASAALLRSTTSLAPDIAALLASQHNQITQALKPVDVAERVVADRVFRDTDNLLLRSSDVTLATTSSYVIEEMIADGEQFDWVIIEEAARASGAELIGALLLGNRRVMIGDHRQLSPFDVVDRRKFYDVAVASELLADAKEQLATISDLPAEVEATLELIKSDQPLLEDVLATAARLEEAFRSIAEREEDREKTSGRPSSIANILLEQSRMHPAISDLVSKTFYDGKLVPSERVKARPVTITTGPPFVTAPIVLVNLPALSKTSKRSFERQVKRSYTNKTEAAALLAAIQHLHPLAGESGQSPTLVILSPYLAQVGHFESLFKRQIDSESGTLFGFDSPRRDGKFVYTSDSFQGGEADVVVASLVRNNALVGTRALGFIRNPQRMNVLLSRARQKLVLATSRQFIEDAIEGVDPDHSGGELEFLRTMFGEVDRLAATVFDGVGHGAAIINTDENGRLRL